MEELHELREHIDHGRDDDSELAWTVDHAALCREAAGLIEPTPQS
ncbi:hypothetical protein [Thiohalocapsa halophila]|nr:hypothetical protein [Thiohalocapsa halophila]